MDAYYVLGTVQDSLYNYLIKVFPISIPRKLRHRV